MQVDTLVRNCKIVTDSGIFAGSIAIEGGKIVGVGKESALPSASHVIDAHENYVMPGAIDPHVHLQGYGPSHGPEDLVRTETKAAVAGGVTTVGAFWFEKDNPDGAYGDVFKRGIELVERVSVTDMIFHGDIFTEEQVAEIPAAARDYGVTSYKIFLNFGSTEGKLYGVRGIDDGLVIEALQKIREIGYPGMAMLHTENMEIITRVREKVKKAGRNDLAAWNASRPGYAEEENLMRAIFFGKVTGAPIYIVHHSGCDNGSGVDAIAKAKREGANVLAETLPSFLIFSQDDYPTIGIIGKTAPPLRDRGSPERLWWGINNGVIDCIGSDQSTVMSRKEREGDGMWSSPSGFPGMETMLPAMLSEGVSRGRISFPKLVQVCCRNTARALGVYPQKGAIALGSDADIVIVDMKKQAKVTTDMLHSASGYSLFEGFTFKGWPVTTIRRGEVVMQDGELIGRNGTGKYIPRKVGVSSAAAPAPQK